MVKLRVGYACINLEDKKNFRTYRLKSIEEQDIAKIREVIYHNIRLVSDTIQYNIKKGIYVYRASADIIPFIANEKLQQIVKDHNLLSEPQVIKEFEYIRQCQQKHDLRLSIHANHFLILASPKKEVVEQSIKELIELNKLLIRMNGKNLVIHIGGAYGNKQETLERFKSRIKEYREHIDFNLLTVENDDKTYTTEDVVTVCEELGLKWVYDIHHERCNPSECGSIIHLLKRYPPDKCHISSGVEGVLKPPHADYIFKEDLESLITELEEAGIETIDVIMEAKKKNLAIFDIMKSIEEGYWEIR